MDLFVVQGGKAIPSVHALIIQPFKAMWEKDTSEDKGEIINIFTYIELLCSPKKSNPFHGYPDEIRPAKIKENIWKDAAYQSPLYTSLEIIRAVEEYKELLHNAAPGYSLYLSALGAADILKDFLLDLNMNRTTNSGALQLKPKDVTSALNEINDVIRNLNDGREKLLAEIKESSKSRNNREIGLFER